MTDPEGTTPTTSTGMKPATPGKLRSPILAAALSFLFPGLGQIAAGRLRRGTLIAAPVVGLLILAGGLAVVDRHDLVAVLTSQQGLTDLLIVDAAVFVFHVWAIVDAFLIAGGTFARFARPRRSSQWAGAAAVVVLVVASAGIHGYVAASDNSIQQSLDAIFNPTGGPSWLTDGSATVPPGYTLPPIPSGADDQLDTPPPVVQPSTSNTPGVSATPAKTPAPVVYPMGQLPPDTGSSLDWASDGFLNVLLIGIDQGPGGGRSYGLRPDSMILLEIDINTGRAAMYGVARNIINIPLPPASAKYYACHCYPDLVDYLWQEAANSHPQYYAQYGTGRSKTASYLRGIGALQGAVSELTGIHVDGSVVINLPGFVKLIDTVTPNGLIVNVPYEIRQTPGIGYEPPNGGRNIYGIDIKPGPQVMHGTVALEFARMRHVVGHDSDYYRMRRQQLVLQALRAQLDPCALLPNIPSIMAALPAALWTNLPLSSVPDLAAIAEHISVGNMAGYSLDPSTTGAQYDVLTVASLKKTRSIVAHGLDKVPAGIAGSSSGGGGGGLSC
jgi:anionic cell wall polymer biosynthesis LytR-Cps2A-Psr (LCP) family protein